MLLRVPFGECEPNPRGNRLPSPDPARRTRGLYMGIDRQVGPCPGLLAGGKVTAKSTMEACLRMREGLLASGQNRVSAVPTPPSQTRYHSRCPKHASRPWVHLPGSRCGQFIRALLVGRSRFAEVPHVCFYRQAHPHEPARRERDEHVLDCGHRPRHDLAGLPRRAIRQRRARARGYQARGERADARPRAGQASCRALPA
jgi:hypothetical protein